MADEKLVGFFQHKTAEIVRERKIWISPLAVAFVEKTKWTAPNGLKLHFGCGDHYYNEDVLHLFKPEKVINVSDLREIDARWPRLKQALSDLAAAAVETSEPKTTVDLTGFTTFSSSGIETTSSQVAKETKRPEGPLTAVFEHDKPVIVCQTYMFLSKKVYKFVKAQKVGTRWSRAWKATNGLVICFGSKTFYWEFRGPTHERSYGHTMLYIPKSACDKISNLDEFLKDAVPSYDMLSVALVELAAAVRESWKSLPPPQILPALSALNASLPSEAKMAFY
jgi:hypothetical protein